MADPKNYLAWREPIVEGKPWSISHVWYNWLNSIVDVLNNNTGDVNGPSSSVNNQIVLFSGTTGQLLKSATGTGIVNAVSGVYQAPYALGSNLEVTSGPTLNAISWVPMSTGAEPLEIMSNGAGQVLLIAYEP